MEKSTQSNQYEGVAFVEDYRRGDEVPHSSRKAALDKPFEPEQPATAEAEAQRLAATQNGSMAPNENEMKKLGEDMKRMKTNAELLEANLIPDPLQ
ncbi:hypothetical protein [Paenibacillus koleovorans]|uniref:hypothetical protein n=1 Tax=Paenibacillus koleovorans TaxID=121608 RepID=UPI000FDCC327|nr:hypothetical protein [Paenibacillus koleovorans]